MRLGIIGPRKRGYEEERLIREGRKLFEEVDYFPIPHITVEMGKKLNITCSGKDLLEYEALLPRIPRSYRTYGFVILTLLEESGKYLPIKPFSLFLSHNKFLTLLCLKEAGLPVPRTFLSLKRDMLEELLDKIKYPLVIKLLYGSRGIGVMFADSKESAISVMDTLQRFDQPIFLEKFVGIPGRDIRAYVVGERVVGVMERRSKVGERRSNIAMGGKGVPYRLNEEEEKLVIRAAKCLGMEVCGVDFIPTPKGPVLIETNVNAQFKGLEETTGVNIARAILNFLKRKVSE